MVDLQDIWLLLPDEIWLRIFGFLNDTDFTRCLTVCTRLRGIGQDKTLRRASQKVLSGVPPHEVFLESCRIGDSKSIDYLTDLLTRPCYTPPGGHLVLWNRGFLEAAKGGHVNIIKKLISFGAEDPTNEALFAACRRHPKMARFLIKEFNYHDSVIRSARDKAEQIKET